MVNLTSETLRVVQIIITLCIMAILLGTIFFLDYFKKHEKRSQFLALISSLYLLMGSLLVIAVIEISAVMTCPMEMLLFVTTIVFMFVILGAILKPELVRKGKLRVVFLVLLLALFIVMVVASVILWVEGSVDYDSLHLGSILGLPALILVTTGTIIVIFDEPKYAIYHGFSAGGAWLLTLLNVILLFSLSRDLMIGYSGWLHALHIICGGVGLTFGFASALFGISGQRRLAKVTGYTTLGCWWLAYFLGFFIVYGNTSTIILK